MSKLFSPTARGPTMTILVLTAVLALFLAATAFATITNPAVTLTVASWQDSISTAADKSPPLNPTIMVMDTFANAAGYPNPFNGVAVLDERIANAIMQESIWPSSHADAILGYHSIPAEKPWGPKTWIPYSVFADKTVILAAGTVADTLDNQSISTCPVADVLHRMIISKMDSSLIL